MRELQGPKERSLIGPDATQTADTELAELHELIANQAQTIDKWQRLLSYRSLVKKMKTAKT